MKNRTWFTSKKKFKLWIFALLLSLVAVTLLKPNEARAFHSPLCKSPQGKSGSCTINLEFRGEPIIFQKVTFETPQKFFLFPVENATIVSSGLVYNATDFFHLGKWYFEKEVTKNSLNFIPLPVEDNEYISIVQIWQDSFQHLSFDTYPRAAYMCEFLLKHQGYRVIAMGTLQVEIFQTGCNLPSSRFRILRESFSARTIYIPTFEKNYPMGIYPKESIKSAGPQLNSGELVIYMPRDEGPRSVENEKDVIQTLHQEFGRKLYVCHPSDNWTDQAEIFSKAQMIIGPHGGAFGNMIFAPVNTTIVEFHNIQALSRASENSRPCYLGLANALGFKYYNFEPENFTFDESMWIDTRKLKEFLQSLRVEL